jgi:DNA-binding CsgD family transcriptional regulator
LDSARQVEDFKLVHDAPPQPSNEEILVGTAQELRLPLSQIKKFVTILLRTDIDWDEETRKEFIAEIGVESDRLAALVDSWCTPRSAAERGLAARGPRVQDKMAYFPRAITGESRESVRAVSSLLEVDSVVRAVQAGAVHYLLNGTNAQESWQAIKAALATNLQLSPEPAARLVREMLAGQSTERLSDRELDVLRLLARGHSNNQIARDLTLSLNTVKTHVSHILRKLGVESRTQAALYAGRFGLVRLHGPTSPGTFAA